MLRKSTSFLLTVACASISFGVEAQNSFWRPVGAPSDTTVTYLFEDTTTNQLIIGGYYSCGMSIYDGNSITPMPTCCSYLNPDAMIRFNDTLFASGNGIGVELMKWNGAVWDTTGSFSVNGSIRSLCVYNNALYAGGTFSQIGGINANCIAKYDGVSWSAVNGFPFSYAYAIYALETYNGELYAGGNFGDSLGNTCNIARWDGAQWQYVGQGFHGGIDEVFCLEKCQSKLFIGGAFKMSDGNVGNYIAQWDGTTLSDVGGGLWDNTNGQVHDLISFHNDLYAVGFFTYAGGVWAHYVAKWDGTNWCGTSDTIYYPGTVTCLGTFRDTLYLGGSFSIISGDSVSKIAKWTGGNFGDSCGNTTSISMNTLEHSDVSVYPNPSNTVTFFQFYDNSNSREIIITDNLGREIWRKETFDMIVEFPARNFPAGLYFYTILTDDSHPLAGKFVIHN